MPVSLFFSQSLLTPVIGIWWDQEEICEILGPAEDTQHSMNTLERHVTRSETAYLGGKLLYKGSMA